LDVAKRLSEYSVIYGKELTVLSLILAVGFPKEEDHFVLQTFLQVDYINRS